MVTIDGVNEYGWNLVHKLHDMGICYELGQSDHNEAGLNFKSQYHAEGDILTHTLMVYSHVIRNFLDWRPKSWKELIIASLLHDIGKPECREWVGDKQRIMFKNHAGVSTFKAIDLIKELDPSFTNEQIVYVLKLINYHGDLFDVNPNKHWAKWKKDSNFLRDLYSLRIADSLGNISKKDPFSNPQHYIIEMLDYISENRKKVYPPFSSSVNAEATFLIGLPNSGKTTYALEEGHNNILSRDQMVLDLAGTDNYDDAWKRVDQKEVDKEFRFVFQQLMKNEYNMVIDRTNLTRKGRMKFVNQLRQKGYTISYKVFLPKLSTIHHRNMLRENKFIPYNVILNMMKSFKMPYDDEYDNIEYFL